MSVYYISVAHFYYPEEVTSNEILKLFFSIIKFPPSFENQCKKLVRMSLFFKLKIFWVWQVQSLLVCH